MTELTEMQLLKLYYCGESMRHGMIDKGDPENLSKLQILGYTAAKDGGYVLTPEGSAYVALNKHKLFPRKKKEKKKQIRERYEEDNEWNDFD
jgi:hypothetical protein